MPVTKAADLRAELVGHHTGYMLSVLVLPLLGGTLVEPVLLLAAERARPARAIGLSLAAMALAMVGCALASSPWLFAPAFAIYCAASGVACGLAQTALVKANPDDQERAMAKWTLAGELGDLAAPLLAWAFAGMWGWRALLVTSAVGLGLWAIVLVLGLALVRTSAAPNDQSDSAEEHAGFFASLRTGITNKKLLIWTFACSLCGLMDETLAALAAEQIQHQSPEHPERAIAISLAAMTIGAGGALVLMERWADRVAPVRLLAISSAACLAFYATWIVTSPTLIDWLLLGLVGFFVAPLYPLTKAQAYRAEPGRGALVNAIAQLFSPIDFVAPLLLGLVADKAGLKAALLVLAIQPLGILAVVAREWAAARRRSSR